MGSARRRRRIVFSSKNGFPRPFVFSNNARRATSKRCRRCWKNEELGFSKRVNVPRSSSFEMKVFGFYSKLELRGTFIFPCRSKRPFPPNPSQTNTAKTRATALVLSKKSSHVCRRRGCRLRFRVPSRVRRSKSRP